MRCKVKKTKSKRSPKHSLRSFLSLPAPALVAARPATVARPAAAAAAPTTTAIAPATASVAPASAAAADPYDLDYLGLRGRPTAVPAAAAAPRIRAPATAAAADPGTWAPATAAAANPGTRAPATAAYDASRAAGNEGAEYNKQFHLAGRYPFLILDLWISAVWVDARCNCAAWEVPIGMIWKATQRSLLSQFA